MKAVTIREHGAIDKLRFEDVSRPEPADGEVLVRVRAAGVNHFDHDIREGISGITHDLPPVPGIECVGEAAVLGPQVSDFAIGDRVAISFSPPASYTQRYMGFSHCRMYRKPRGWRQTATFWQNGTVTVMLVASAL